MDIVSTLVGGAAVAVSWFTWLAGKKAVPAALGWITSWIREKWSGGEDLLGELETRVSSEIDHVHGLIGELTQQHTVLQAAVTRLEARLLNAPPAPAPVLAAAPIAPAAPAVA
ncbi:hypothetical protein ACVWXN_003454 [Bradyrhizobium sp. i1.4.4]